MFESTRFLSVAFFAFSVAVWGAGCDDGSDPEDTDDTVVIDDTEDTEDTEDVTPPTAPSGLATLVQSDSQIDLSWDASTDDVGVTEYRVYRDGATSPVHTVVGLSASDSSLTATAEYCYTVTAVDAAGNESVLSDEACATTLAPPDTERPTMPLDLQAVNQSHSEVALTWTASTDNVGVTEYLVYRNGSSTPIHTGDTDTSFLDDSLTPSTSYCYRVTALDAAGNESPESNEACTFTPDPPDTTPPSVPTGLVATAASSSHIDVSWDASTDNVGVHAYRIYKNGGATYWREDFPTVLDDYPLSEYSTHCYEVSAVDAAGNESGKSTEACATTLDVTPPSQPPNVSADGISFSEIEVTWDPATDNVGVVEYQVFRDNDTTPLWTTSNLTITDSGLPYESVHCYHVVAVDAAGKESMRSTACGGTLQDVDPPSTPQNAAAVAVSTERIDVTWDPSTDDYMVTQYRVLILSDVGFPLDSVTTTTTSFSHEPLSPNTTYCYQVVAEDIEAHQSDLSTMVCATTHQGADTTPPTAPANLVGNAVSPSQIDLTWDASTDDVGVTGYRVYGGSNPVPIETVTGTSSSQASLNPSVWYCFHVTAIDAGNNESGPSNQVCEETPPDSTPPTAPTGLTALGISVQQIDLSWAASTDDVGVVEYKLYRDGSGTALQTFTGTTATDPGRQPDTQHCYEVTALDAAGNESPRSTSACGSTLPDTTPPSVPTGLIVLGSTYFEMDLAWNASTDDVGVVEYRIYRNYIPPPTDPRDPWLQDPDFREWSEVGTSTTDTGLYPNGDFDYQVTAVDAAGNESAMTAVVVGSTQMDTTPPSVPTGVEAVNDLDPRYGTYVSWDASTDDVAMGRYIIERAAWTGEPFYFVTTVNGPGYHDTDDAQFYSRRCYRVRAVDAGGNSSAFSTEGCATNPVLPPDPPPTIPQNVIATASAHDQIDLSWDPSTDLYGFSNQITYKIFRDGDGSELQSVFADTSTSDLTVEELTEYCYRVSASYPGSEESALSDQACATTPISPDISPPTAPPNLQATVINAYVIDLTWDDATDDRGVHYYAVYDYDSDTLLKSVQDIATRMAVQPSTTYCYYVTAFDHAGNEGPISNIACGTTPANNTYLLPVADNLVLATSWDTTVADTAFPDGQLGVGSFWSPTVFFDQSLLLFDVDALSRRTITSATLYLYPETLPTDFNTVYQLNALDGPWSDTVTYNTVPPNRSGYMVSAGLPGTTAFPVAWDVTGIVQMWVDGTWSNDGMAIWDPATSWPGYDANRVTVFHSLEVYDVPTNRPGLYIEYQ